MALIKIGQRVRLRSGITGTAVSILQEHSLHYWCRYRVKLDVGGYIGVHGTDVLEWWDGSEDEKDQLALAAMFPKGRLLYFSCVDKLSQDFFFCSNENDWRGVKKDAPSISGVSAVISFSNNVGWDQVVENQGEHLILCDWQATPLLVQEHLFRPLLVLCDTPIEFFCYLYGEPRWLGLAKECKDDYRPALAAIAKDLEKRSEGSKFDESGAQEFHKHVLLSLRQKKLESRFLALYFEAVRAVRAGRMASWPFSLNFRRILGEEPKQDGARDVAYEFCFDLLLRYSDLKKVSCMSGPKEFKYLKKIMESRVYYVKGNLQERGLWERLALLLRAGLGPDSMRIKSVTLHLSNVVDYILYAARKARTARTVPYRVLVEVGDRWTAKNIQPMAFFKVIFECLDFIPVRFIYFTLGGMEDSNHVYALVNSKFGMMWLK